MQTPNPPPFPSFKDIPPSHPTLPSRSPSLLYCRQLVTASFIPGTTLDFVKVDVRGTLMYDTPGILMPHQLTSRLTSEEIAAVVPSKRIRPVTLRIAPQHGVLIGAGLAQVDVVAGKAMQLTFFMAPDVTLHPCKTEGAAEKVCSALPRCLSQGQPPFAVSGKGRCACKGGLRVWPRKLLWQVVT